MRIDIIVFLLSMSPPLFKIPLGKRDFQNLNIGPQSSGERYPASDLFVSTNYNFGMLTCQEVVCLVLYSV